MLYCKSFVVGHDTMHVYSDTKHSSAFPFSEQTAMVGFFFVPGICGWLLFSSLLCNTMPMNHFAPFQINHLVHLIVVEPIVKSKPFHCIIRILLHSRIRLLFVVDSLTLSQLVCALTPMEILK